MCNWKWKFYETKMIGTQTSCFTNFGRKLSFILSFLFPDRLHCCYIYFHCSYLYNYYNYSQTLCTKCWVSAFHIEISLLCRYHWKREDRGCEDRVTLWRTLMATMKYSHERRSTIFKRDLVQNYVMSIGKRAISWRPQETGPQTLCIQ
jgi:hypothetical protein